APAEPVGELAEHQGPGAGADDVDGRGEADPAGADVDPAARIGQPRRDRADHRHLEAAEQPDRAEPDPDPPVAAGPGQAVLAGRGPGGSGSFAGPGAPGARTGPVGRPVTGQAGPGAGCRASGSGSPRRVG